MRSRPKEDAAQEGLPHVVIVGAGFAGLNCAKALKKAPVRVTVVDRQNHHLFQPLLYQVATAALSGPDIAAPIRQILRGVDNATVLLDSVVDVDPESKTLTLERSGATDESATQLTTMDYDFLVVATGSRHTYFGHDEWEPLAPGLKTLADAHEIRRRILLAFEDAERRGDQELTFVVVGGGPTGVELAGAIAEIASVTLARDFRNINTKDTRVVLVEAGPRVLAAYTQKLSDKAKRQLETLGVEVRLDSAVETIDSIGVTLQGGERIDAATVLWGAGVAGSPLGAKLGGKLHRSGRVITDPRLFVPKHPQVFVAGDLAFAQASPSDDPVPALAPAAMQMGRYVGKAIMARLGGKAPEDVKPFRYLDKGSLATIGRSKAVGQALGIQWSGFPAWVAWLFIHLLFLVDFRTKLMVMLEWAWAYVSYGRSARIILENPRPERDTDRPPPRDFANAETVAAAVVDANVAPAETPSNQQKRAAS